MNRAGYPYGGSHRAQHETFLSRLAELQKKLVESDDKEEVAKSVAHFGVDWFVHHIQSSDQPLVRYFAEANRPAADAAD